MRAQGVAVILVAGMLVTLSGCRGQSPASSASNPAGEDPASPKRVRTARVVTQPLEETVAVMGTLAAYDQATLKVKVPGRVQTITVDLGSIVRQGQVIAQIEPRDYQLRVEQAEAALAQARARLGLPIEGTDDRVDPEQTALVRQARAVLEEARATYERSARLLEEGIIPRSRFDADEAAYKVALSRYQDALEEVRNRQALLAQRRAELALARQQLADTVVYAPFDGVVQERHTSVGEFLAAGAPVATIVRIDPLRLRAEVPEREAPRVRPGQRVRVRVEGDPSIYTGRIVRLSPTITLQTRMLVVEAEVRNTGQLRPGAFARVEILTGEGRPAPVVPPNALVSFAGLEKVFVVQQGKAVEKRVTTGRRTGEWVEILSGLEPGEEVILDPGNLQPGQAVIPVRERS
jgi:RND family efflux transporter MFP subunit